MLNDNAAANTERLEGLVLNAALVARSSWRPWRPAWVSDRPVNWAARTPGCLGCFGCRS